MVHNATKKLMSCGDQATFSGLKQWYKHEFTHLGWMILAKEKKGMNDKIVSYKKSLRRLKKALECKVKQTFSPDKKNDLLIMWNDINTLIIHVEKDFK